LARPVHQDRKAIPVPLARRAHQDRKAILARREQPVPLGLLEQRAQPALMAPMALMGLLARLGQRATRETPEQQVPKVRLEPMERAHRRRHYRS
jgi:hypothetical protein